MVDVVIVSGEKGILHSLGKPYYCVASAHYCYDNLYDADEEVDDSTAVEDDAAADAE